MRRAVLRRITLAVAVAGLLGFATGCPDDDLGDEIENEIDNIGAVEAQTPAPTASLPVTPRAARA